MVALEMTKKRYLILFLIGLLGLTACQNGPKDPAAVSESISEWFRGSAAGSEVTLTADSGAALQLTLAQETAVGTFTPVGGAAQSFTANKAAALAGLYRAEETIDSVAYVGGWIILADGQQRGAVKARGVVVASPFMDPDVDLVVNIPNIGNLVPLYLDPENDL